MVQYLRRSWTLPRCKAVHSTSLTCSCACAQWRNLLQTYAAGVRPADADRDAFWNVGGAYHAALLEAEMRAALRGNVAAIAAANAAHAVLIAALQ